MSVKIVIDAVKFLPMLISPHRIDGIGKRNSHIDRVAKLIALIVVSTNALSPAGDRQRSLIKSFIDFDCM